MSAFDKIAVYDALKKEIEEICFLLKEGQICKDKGIRLPKGTKHVSAIRFTSRSQKT